MTVKEIAQAIGKDDRSIQRWIQKILPMQNACVDRQDVAVDRQDVGVNDVLNGKMRLRNSIAEKAGNKDPHHPADYTPEEASLIVEAGLGRNAAGIFQANLGMAAELAQIKERYEKSTAVFEGLRADFQKFLENNSQKALPDPNEAANRELADFVRENLTITGKHARDFVNVSTLYDMYRGYVDHVLPERTFMYKIVLDNPAIELKIRRYTHDLTGCCYRH